MNPAWATEWLRRFSARDPGELMDMYADDAEFEDVTFNQEVHGKTSLRAFFAKFMDPAARENSFAFVTYSGNTNAGAVEWLWKATHNQDFAGLSARGRETKVRGVSVLTFGSGKIASCHDYWDARTLMQQLGAATS